MAVEAEAVGAEGVGFKDFCAGLEIFLVDGEDEVGVGKVQLVVTAVDEDSARIEDRAHGAIGEHGAVGEDIGKLGHSIVMLSHSVQGLYLIVRRTAARAVSECADGGIKSNERVALLYFESQKLCRTSPG